MVPISTLEREADTEQYADVLKFEYMTQLLLDSNYIPLVLKLFAHQDIQQAVDSTTDRVEHRYVNWSRGGNDDGSSNPLQFLPVLQLEVPLEGASRVASPSRGDYIR